jgi:hypothetical protein
MTENEAKEILKLYRPGTADAEDPSFTEALAVCERDTELKNWFAEHCALYSALRAKFKQITVPEGLKEQIVAERKSQAASAPIWQKAVILAGAVAAVALVAFEIQSTWQPREPHDFAHYRGFMVGFAERAYGMVPSGDLNQIRQFLAESKAIADYDLPENLQKNAKVAGCVATTWQGKKVSMICFQTRRSLKPGLQSDLWLFITDRSTALDTPSSATPQFEEKDGVTTANWTVGNKTYVLAVEGDKELLGQFL